MKRPQGPVRKDDIRPRDVIAYKNKAGLWSIRHIDDSGAPDGTDYVLLSTLNNTPDAPVIVVDDGFIGADPSTGRPMIEFMGALAVRDNSNSSETARYVFPCGEPFTLDAEDIAHMVWHKVSVVDTQEATGIADAYSCQDLKNLLDDAWGENND